ncbi:MAG: FecR domain-containing protein [Deltaproteobacteria bacterium]|nr:FecR domain-containing protein [Deltaproteobacteria bacterium]
MTKNTSTNHSVRRRMNVSNRHLDDLFLEVSAQRDRIAVDPLRKKRIISRVIAQPHLLDDHSEPDNLIEERIYKTAFPTAKVAIAAIFLLAASAALFRFFVYQPAAAPQVKAAPASGSAPHIIAAPSVKPLRARSHENSADKIPAQKNTSNDISVVPLNAGIQLAIAPRAQYTLSSVGKNSIILELSYGTLWISKDPQYGRTPLTIKTPHGQVQVTGTSLSVSVTSETTVVKLLDGEVHILDNVENSHVLTAGNMLTATRSLTKTEAIPDLPVKMRHMASLGLKVSFPRNLSEPKPGTRMARANAIKTSRERKTLDELFAEIQMNRKQKNWQAAVEGYHSLILQYEHDGKTQAAKVAMANLYLEKLHQPDVALKWYDAYLKSGSQSLAPEALQGKSRALRDLNQPSAERQILEEIVQKFPQTPYGMQAQQRLHQLQD